MEIQNPKDFRKELLKKLQANFQCKGMTMSQFEKSLVDTGSAEIMNYLRLTPYKNLEDAIKGFFPNIIRFSGDVMYPVSIEALACGNENLIHLYSLQSRTNEKNGTKSSGREKRKKFRTRRSNNLANVGATPISNIAYDPPVRVDDRYQQFEYQNDYGEYDYYDEQYQRQSPSGFSYDDYPHFEDDFSQNYYSNKQHPMSRNLMTGFNNEDKSEAERKLWNFIKAFSYSPSNVNYEISDAYPELADEVYSSALKTYRTGVTIYMEKREWYRQDKRYFHNVISDIYDLLVRSRHPLPFHHVLVLLENALFPKPGFNYLDVYNVIRALGEDFFRFTEDVEDCISVLMIETNDHCAKNLLSELDKLLKEPQLSIESKICKRKVCTSQNYEFPYYILSPMDQIEKKLRCVDNFETVKLAYPKELCLVKVEDELYRAVVITCEDFDGKGIQIELIDVGTVIRKPLSELYMIKDRDLLDYPRLAVPAVLKLDSSELDISEFDEKFERWISPNSIQLSIDVENDFVTFHVLS